MKEKLIANITLLDGAPGEIYVLGDTTNIEIVGVSGNEEMTLSEGHEMMVSCVDFVKTKYGDKKWDLKLV